jgi:hypothetical protein
MKGFSFTMEVIIALFLAVVVIVALLGFFLGVWTPGTNVVVEQQVKSSACQKLISEGCQNPSNIYTNDFDSDKNGSVAVGSGVGNCGDDVGDNLMMLCRCYFNKPAEPECKELCGC